MLPRKMASTSLGSNETIRMGRIVGPIQSLGKPRRDEIAASLCGLEYGPTSMLV